MKHQRAVLVSVAVAASLTLVGCTGGGNTPQPSESVDPSALTYATPAGTKEVEHVKWGLLGGDPPSLDTVKAGVDTNYIPLANMCEALLQPDPEFAVKPNLATAVEWKDDTTLVIDLRDDVTFWDGAPMTPEDVVFSLKRSADPNSGSVNVSAFSNVVDMAVTGEHQVTITLSAPQAEFREALAGPGGYIHQKAFTEAKGEDVGTPGGGIMCTGPFQLDKWTPGTSITMTAVEDHWRQTPLVKELEIVLLTNDATMTSALLSGELDGAFSVSSASADRFRASDQGSLYLGPSTAFAVIGGATDTGPAADPRVRTALDLAIDKKAAIAAAMNGIGEPVRTFVVPFVWEGKEYADIYRAGYDALPDNTVVDIEEAKALIEEADATGAKLVLGITAGDQSALSLATITQAAGKEIGLDIEIKQMQGPEFAKIFYDPTGRDGLDFVLTGGYSDMTVLTYPSFFVIPGGLFNWTGYDDPEVGRLMAEASAATDPKVAAEKFVEAQALYVPTRPLIMFGSEYTRTFLSDDLTGVTTSFAYMSSPWALNLGGK